MWHSQNRINGLIKLKAGQGIRPSLRPRHLLINNSVSESLFWELGIHLGYIVRPCLKTINKTRAWEMDPVVKCLPYKHEDVGLDP